MEAEGCNDPMSKQKNSSDKSRTYHLAPWLPEEAVLVAKLHQKKMARHAYTDEALDRFQRLFCKNHEHEAQQRKLWGKLDNSLWKDHLYKIAKLSFDLPTHWFYVEPYKLRYPPKEVGRIRPEKIISQIASTTEKLVELIEVHPFLYDFFNSHKEYKDLNNRLYKFSKDIKKWDRHSNNRSTNNELFEGSSHFKSSKIAQEIRYFCREMYLAFVGGFNKRPAYGIIADISNLLFDTDFAGENIKKMTSDLRGKPSLVKK